MTNRRQFIQASAASAALGLGSMPAFSQQALPELLRIIVGFPPGGTTDAFARRIGEKLQHPPMA
jgi:tripartite-type tricarboxylate transporter receptor subunit TctC